MRKKPKKINEENSKKWGKNPKKKGENWRKIQMEKSQKLGERDPKKGKFIPNQCSIFKKKMGERDPKKRGKVKRKFWEMSQKRNFTQKLRAKKGNGNDK